MKSQKPLYMRWKLSDSDVKYMRLLVNGLKHADPIGRLVFYQRGSPPRSCECFPPPQRESSVCSLASTLKLTLTLQRRESSVSKFQCISILDFEHVLEIDPKKAPKYLRLSHSR